MSSMQMNRSKKKAVGVLAGFLAFGGLAAIALPANAETSAAANPTIKLTSVDTDTVVASGRNFASNTDITVAASSKTLSGSGKVRTGVDGRFLVAFRLPAGFNDKLSVVSKTPDATASINVSTPGTSTTSSSTTSTTSATSTTSTTVPVPASGTPQLDTKLNALPGMDAYNKSNDAFNAAVATFNLKKTSFNLLLNTASDAKYNSIKSQLDASKADLTAMNAQTTKSNAAIAALNAKVAAATTQAQLEALNPQLVDLARQADANLVIAKRLNASIDSMTATLKS